MKRAFSAYLLLLCVSTAAANSLEGKVEFKAALENYQQQKFLMSIGGFRKALDLDYKTAEVYFYLGNALTASQSFSKALLQYKIALELDPEPELAAVILYNMGNASYQMKDYTNAVRFFNDSYQYNPGLPENFWLQGMSWYQLRDKERTIQSWENYLVLAPQGPQSDNIRKALELLRQVDFRFPDAEGQGNNKGTKNGVDLVNIEGVLDKVELEDKGKAEDTELEDLEM